MTEANASEWFRDAFGELYPLVYPHRDDETAAREVAHLVDVLGLRSTGALVLDLACGTGRHAAALAQSGLRVVALDLSPPLITEAAGRPQLEGRLVRGDMRCLPFRPVFDLVVNLFTSFGYFSDEENQLALMEMVRVLSPGGRLVIDHINKEALECTLVERDARLGEGFTIHQKRRVGSKRVQKDILIAWQEGATTRLCEDVRLYTPEELAECLEATGLVKTRFYGSYDGARLSRKSERMIAVGTKAKAGG